MAFRIKKMALALACVGGLGASPVQAANWLALQGLEPTGQAPRAKVWGFIQPEVQYTDGTELAAGPYAGKPAQFNMIRPNATSRATFQIRRARVGVRGQGFPLDNKTNYFFLVEFGNNGITVPGGGKSSAKLTDASVTFSHIPHARVRVGQFKTPGAEEGLQAIHVFDYINFTFVTDQLLLERFFDPADGTGTAVGGFYDEYKKPMGSVGAFRDIGVQVFDIKKMGRWEHSYAVMVGNGNGIARSDIDGKKDLYLYWSSAQVYGGKGPRRQEWKLFAWRQSGKRTLYSGQYDRTRAGFGTTFRKGKLRAAAEYIVADGVIFSGTKGGGRPLDSAPLRVAPEGEANGWYIHGGYMATKRLELDVRYDVLNRNTNKETEERKFSKITLGAQYFFNKKTRAVFNYEIRKAEAPNLADTATPNKILSGMDNVISMQVLAVF